jgi:hypothetical protein
MPGVKTDARVGEEIAPVFTERLPEQDPSRDDSEE